MQVGKGYKGLTCKRFNGASRPFHDKTVRGHPSQCSNITSRLHWQSLQTACCKRVLQATVTAQKFLLLSLPSEPQSQLPRLVQSQS